MPTAHQRRLLQAVRDLLTHHDEAEQSLIEEYGTLAREDPDDTVRYLATLIVQDEERHHRLNEDLAARIDHREGALTGPESRSDPELLAATRALLKRERQDMKELRRLRRELRALPPDPFVRLLVELMLNDTARHVEILGYIRDYIG